MTTKQFNQMVQNLTCEEIWRDVEKEIGRCTNTYGTPFRTCSATVFTTENFIVLRSYRTPIACIDRRTNYGYDVLRMVYGYTATSAQHISKFFADYKPTMRWTWKDVPQRVLDELKEIRERRERK